MENVGSYEYDKKDLIGHGAFAVVFKGKSSVDHSVEVAIKSISKKNLSKAQTLLGKEINILKELHHENIVRLLDCIENPTNVFLVMEFCNGGDLADYLQLKGTLSEDTIRIFLIQIASALQVLSSKGIVHRDLKPQNILLSHQFVTLPQPAEIKIKIADFGFARFLHGEMMAATLCGSPMYMAPEVIMSKTYDAKADLWSVGTIVYQCLTGKAPFQANNPQNLRKLYETTRVLRPNIPSGCSSVMKDLLYGLLKRNPKERFNFDEFFGHTFLVGKSITYISTPVAVPSRRRGFSECSRGIRSPMDSLSSSPKYTDYLQQAGMSSPHEDTKLYVGRVSPQATQPCVTRQKHSSSVPDDFVLVPYDIRCESPRSLGGRTPLRGRDMMYSPAESSSPKSRIERRDKIFSIGSPPGSPHDYDRTLSNLSRTSSDQTLSSPRTSPLKAVKQNKTKSLSPSPSPRTPSPLARDLVTPPPLMRKSSLKVSTPPTLESVQDLGENTQAYKSGNAYDKQIVSTRSHVARPRRTTISNASSPMSELRKADMVPYVNLLKKTNSNESKKTNIYSSVSKKFPVELVVQKVDIRKSKSSPALISEAVKDLPVHAPDKDTVNTNLTALLKQLAQENLRPNILAKLPSPSFKLINSPPSPKFIIGENTPPPGLFLASSPASWQDKIEYRKRVDMGGSIYSRHSISLDDQSKIPEATVGFDRSHSVENNSIHLVKPAQRSSSFQERRTLEQPSPNKQDLSIGPLTLHSPSSSSDDETLLSQEHIIAMDEIEFLLKFSRTLLNTISNLNLSSYVMDLLSEQKQRQASMLPTVDGIKYEKLLLILEALRVSSHALRFSKSYQKKGTLSPTKKLKHAVGSLTSLCQECIQRMAFHKQLGHSLPGNINQFKADTAKLLYLYGVGACQFAASSELMGNLQESLQNYMTSQVIFQGLLQQSRSSNDKLQISKYIKSIKRRVELLDR